MMAGAAMLAFTAAAIGGTLGLSLLSALISLTLWPGEQ